jgi:hypothetical protein
MTLVHLTHFWALLIFSALISIAIGVLERRTAARRIKYALWSFACFVVVSVAIAWLLYPLSR